MTTYPDKISFYNFVVEITRRCDMKCPHCLRGEAENKDLNITAFDKLCQKTKYISSLTITGGEPSLNPNGIINIINIMKKYNVGCGNFYVATNGKNITEEFAIAMLKLYSFCDDNEVSQIEVSDDEFHDKDRHYELLKGLSSFSGKKECDYKKYGILNIGRAKNIKNYKKSKIIRDQPILEDDFISEGLITMTVDGDLLIGICDYAFKDAKEISACNVNEENWKNILCQKINDGVYINPYTI